MASKIQFRRDTSTNWSNTNPTLAQGEPGIETNTLKFKIGDGTTAWNSLNYAGFSASGFVFGEWDGSATISNDLANEWDYIQLQAITPYYDSNIYGRATLSWHDSGNYSNYTHVHVDPYGASIRIADWSGNTGGGRSYWEFQKNGRTRFPNGLIFDTWNDSNISNDYIKLYETDQSGESNGEYNAYVVQLQSLTRHYDNNDYGRATLSWHDYNYSNYTHIQADPNGAAIRIDDWSGNRGGYHHWWAFNNDGTTAMPGSLTLNNGGQEVFGLTTTGYNQSQTTVTSGYLQVAMNATANVLIASSDPTGHPFQVAFTGTFTNVSTGVTTSVGNSYLVCNSGSPSFTVTDYSSNPITFANRGDTLIINLQLPDLGQVYRVTVIATDPNNSYTAGNSSIIIERLV